MPSTGCTGRGNGLRAVSHRKQPALPSAGMFSTWPMWPLLRGFSDSMNHLCAGVRRSALIAYINLMLGKGYGFLDRGIGKVRCRQVGRGYALDRSAAA